MTDLLVLLALWCFACACFGFGWIMGHASALGHQADELAERFADGPPADDPRWDTGRW